MFCLNNSLEDFFAEGKIFTRKRQYFKLRKKKKIPLNQKP